MKRLLLIIILLVFSLVACEDNENEQVRVEENIYESPYVKDYGFPVEVMNEVYYSHHDVFAGFYLADGYNVNITENAPQTLIDKLEQDSLVTHHIVDYSFAELWAVKEIVFDIISDSEGFSGLGVSEMNNTVELTLITDTVIPESLNHYIEIGILTIDFQDTHVVVT
ncbi:hypothetical protein [Haloplasma contractile]|nr:hypothetical protein [Haloplasma contractile]